jgi:hypothetical protein
MSITPLNISDTFQTWYTTTNSIISEINGITIHNLIPGDGISLTSNGNNVYTIKHGTSVATPVTFTGPVSFTNTVSFSSAPLVNTMVTTISPKTSGITAGNVVRVTTTGLTLAKADTVDNAEVFGVVISSDASTDTIATSGIISNTNFSATIGNMLGIVGATLTTGCAYFLSPTVAGGITTVEPNTYGQVSKPILLGITGTQGLFLPHRGIQIEGISAGITAELDNKAIIQIDYSSGLNTGGASNLKIGDAVILVDGDFSNSTLALNLLNVGAGLRLQGTINSSGINQLFIVGGVGLFNLGSDVFGDKILGLVSKILVHDTINKQLTIEITLPGGSFNATISNLDTQMYPYTDKTRSYFYDILLPTSWVKDTTGAQYKNKFLDFIRYNDPANTAKIIFHNNIRLEPSQQLTFVGSGSGSGSGMTASLEYDNLIPNGSFSIWQRSFNNLNGVTFAGLSGYNTPIADRWFYVTDSVNLSGLSLSVQKQSFNASQTEVPGSPLYWVDLKQTYTSTTGLNYRPRFENIQKGAKLLQGQQATVTFWAVAGICGATMDLVYNRYPEDTEHYATITDLQDALSAREVVQSGIQLSTNWTQYNYTFTATAQGVVSNSEEGWFGLGFEFPSRGVTLSVAQVKLELGSDVADYIYTLPEKDLQQCAPYYLRTYDWNQATGYSGSSKLNEQYVQLGNLLSQKIYTIPFTTELVQTPRSVTLYSSTGEKNEAFNVTKNIDMRYPTCEGCPIHVNLPWDTSTVRTSLPSGNIAVVDQSKNGMQVIINNGATHLDQLKFHYVADADIKFSTT